MESINHVIVKLEEEYINDKNGIIINNSIENVSSINRQVTVVTAPKNTILKEGDELIIHHNIIRNKYDIKGKQIKSNFWIEDKFYYVPLTEIFMYKRNNLWESLNPYCFVKPILENNNYIGFDIKETSYKNRVNHQGILLYSNSYLKDKGIEKGDKICFSNFSEYEFEIDGEIVYKMQSKDILFKLN